MVNKDDNSIFDEVHVSPGFLRLRELATGTNRSEGEVESETELKPSKKKDLLEKLAPLEKVFLPQDFRDQALSSLGLATLVYNINGDANRGAVITGPPGSGKSVFLRAIRQVYENFGSYTADISVSGLDSQYVSVLAKNLEKEIKEAAMQQKERNKPSFLVFDEGSSIISNHNNYIGPTRHQEAIDVLKRYIGNDAGKGVIIAISSNDEKVVFDEALVRDGRLKVLTLGLPKKEQIKQMWGYFSNQHSIPLDEQQIDELTALTEGRQGALIENFCSGYKERTVLGIETTLYDRLRSGKPLPENPFSEFSYSDFRNAFLKRTDSAAREEKTMGFRRF